VVVQALSAPVERLPFLTADGTLVIPFDSPERYHWWKPPHEERMRVAETLTEVKETMKHAVTVRSASRTGQREEAGGIV
jgi:hypothetical protein